MIDLYFWTTPNGYKVLLLDEELKLGANFIPVNISTGEQFAPDFLKVSLNNKIPAMVDHAPAAGGEPVTLFESGAILLYLAEKSGRLIPRDAHGRAEVLQWLFWQMSGLGPTLGQFAHFGEYAPEPVPYAIERFSNAAARLLQVMDQQLAKQKFLAGDYSIADIATYPWLRRFPDFGGQLGYFPHVERWLETVGQRSAVQRSYARGADITTQTKVIEESRQLPSAQDASSLVA